MVEDNLASARDYLMRVSSELRKNHEVRVTMEIKVGKPADVITELAETEFVDAIVMSTHGRNGFERFIFGSVTQKVLNAMPCPVFVIPGKQLVKTEDEAPFGLSQAPIKS
jgi:nucleotide-binding universal stress UspA family protein